VVADSGDGGAEGRADFRPHLTFGSVRSYVITTSVIFLLLAIVNGVQLLSAVHHRGDLWYIVTLAVIAAVCVALFAWAWRLLADRRD
jgi:hypothetical protein